MTDFTLNMRMDIQKAIEENLPAMVGSQLKELIFEYERLKKANASMEIANETYSTELKTLRSMKLEREHLDQANEESDRRTRELDARKALLDQQEKYMEARLNDMRSLTQTVFSSNRIGYNVNLNKTEQTTSYNGQGGGSSNSQVFGQITETV